MSEFLKMDKITRFNREVIVTEKIDGTNASIYIGDDGEFRTGSRTRWISVGDDNFGFAAWAEKNKDELMKLGPGHHFGEWWGSGIQRNYGLKERRFSLFNVARWATERPACCHVVPELWRGMMVDLDTPRILMQLETYGSQAEIGFRKPEGIVIYHTASRSLFKRTIDKDEEHKGQQGGLK